jgi:hypothetical protein
MEDESGGDAAEVTLNADASPFEAGLDKAAAGVNGWAGKVSARFDALSTSISAKTDKVAGLFSSISEKAAAGVGTEEALGGMLGGALGSFAGPLGAKIGAELGTGIGKAVGDTLDLESVVSGVGDFSTPIKSQLDDIKAAGEGLRLTFERVWGEVKSLTTALDISELIGGSLADAEGKVTDFGAAVGGKLEGLFGQAMARVSDLIDGAFGRLQEPLAKVADLVQGALRHFGLLSEGTAGWGDSIRAVGDVGTQVFVALARGLGYVQAAVDKVGGFVEAYLQAPFLMLASMVVEAFTDVSETISDVLGGVKEAALGLLRFIQAVDPTDLTQRGIDALNRWDTGAATVRKSLQKAADDMAADAVGAMISGEDRLAAAMDEFADRNEAVVRRMLPAGQLANGWEDFFRTLEREWDAANVRAEAAAEEVAVQASPAAAARRASALVGGSREAVSAIIANAGPGGRPDPALAANQKAAAGIMRLIDLSAGIVPALEKLRQEVKNKPVIEAEEE